MHAHIEPGQVRQFHLELAPYIQQANGKLYHVKSGTKFVVTENSFGEDGEIWSWELILDNGDRIWLTVDRIWTLTEPL